MRSRMSGPNGRLPTLPFHRALELHEPSSRQRPRGPPCLPSERARGRCRPPKCGPGAVKPAIKALASSVCSDDMDTRHASSWKTVDLFLVLASLFVLFPCLYYPYAAQAPELGFTLSPSDWKVVSSPPCKQSPDA